MFILRRLNIVNSPALCNHDIINGTIVNAIKKRDHHFVIKGKNSRLEVKQPQQN